VEELFLTAKLAKALKAPAWLVSRTGEGDGLLVSADRNPNVRGALVTGLISSLPSARLDELAARIDAGEIRSVVSVGEDLAAAGIGAKRLAKVSVVYLGTHSNPTSACAMVVLPTLTVFEKSGTLVNQQFRIQKFARAVPGLTGAADDLLVLSRLVSAAGGPGLGADAPSLWASISQEVPALATMSYDDMPATGLLLDAAPWSQLAFAEGPSLHYQPAQAQKEAPARG
jgi:NADH-quinone oxidoreductase subunit G